MAFSYSVGGDTDLNTLRLEIGDTISATAKFQDEELNDIIDDETDVFNSAARCFEILSNRHAGDFNFSADGASFQKGSLSEAYRKRAQDYRFKAQSEDTQTSTVTRVDGYSDDVAADETDATTSNWTRLYG